MPLTETALRKTKEGMEMSTQATSQKKNNKPGERSDLDRRYGRIGISAVAAAAPYHSNAKKPAPSPVSRRPYESEEEAE